MPVHTHELDLDALASQVSTLELRTAKRARRRADATRAAMLTLLLAIALSIPAGGLGPLHVLWDIAAIAALASCLLAAAWWIVPSPAGIRLRRLAGRIRFHTLPAEAPLREGDAIGGFIVETIAPGSLVIVRGGSASMIALRRWVDVLLVVIGLGLSAWLWALLVTGARPFGPIEQLLAVLSFAPVAAAARVFRSPTAAWRLYQSQGAWCLQTARVRFGVRTDAPLPMRDANDLCFNAQRHALMWEGVRPQRFVQPLSAGTLAEWQVRRIRRAVRTLMDPEHEPLWQAIEAFPPAEGLAGAWAASLGPAPREKRSLPEAPWPRWMRADREGQFAEMRREFEFLVMHGQVVVGVLAMANQLLFEPGKDSHPAAGVWSPDPEVNADPAALESFAERAFSLKHHPVEDPEFSLVTHVMDDAYNPVGFRLPDRVTDGRAAYLCSVMIFREWLEAGYLDRERWAFLVHQDSRIAIVLPSAAG